MPDIDHGVLHTFVTDEVRVNLLVYNNAQFGMQHKVNCGAKSSQFFWRSQSMGHTE